MSEVFGEGYAEAYDLLYGDKDYEAECDLIESVANDVGASHSAYLDLGCGTGGHAMVLASRGNRVTGVDVSEDMVAIARRHAADSGLSNAEFYRGDIRTFRTGESFDIALMMFAVLGYQLTDDDVHAALTTGAEHLRPGGLLIFDVWHGPAVEAIGPTTRSKRIRLPDGELVRSATGVLDPERRLCVVDYSLTWVVGGRATKTTREQHHMRYFFDQELRVAAERAGLHIVRSGAFPEFLRPAGPADWNALYVARRA